MSMREVWKFRVRTSSSVGDMAVTLPIGATVGQLARALEVSPDLMTIDGRRVAAHRTIASTGARNASVVAVDADDADENDSLDDRSVGIVTLDQIAGLSGVGSTELSQGRYDFTPASGSPTTDFRVSDINFTLDVAADGAVTVLPRENPVVIDDALISEPRKLADDVLNVGSARFQARSTEQLRRQAADGDVSRSAVSKVRTLATPAVSSRSARPLSMTWLALAPLAVIFAVLGAIVHELFFVVAGLVLVLAVWYVFSHIRSERRTDLAHHRENERRIREFEQQVRAERRMLAAELRRAHPAIPDILRTVEAANPDEPIWQRDIGDHDFGHVSLGLGDVSWKLRTSGDEPSSVVKTIIHRNGVLPSVPIVADVADGTIGIAGDRSSTLSCARAIVASLASQSGPDVERMALCAESDRIDDWDWMKWLPQTQSGPSLATTPAEADRLVSSWRTPGHDWMQVVVVDQPAWARDEASLLCTVGREPGKQVLIVLADHLHRLPDCATTIDIASDGTATVRVGTVTHRFVTPVGANSEVAERIACELARCAARSHVVDVEADAEQNAAPFGLARMRRPEPTLKSQVDTEESDGTDLDGNFDLVPPPIPVSAVTTIDLSERSDDHHSPEPESSPATDADPSETIDLRERVDTLADVVDGPPEERHT